MHAGSRSDSMLIEFQVFLQLLKLTQATRRSGATRRLHLNM